LLFWGEKSKHLAFPIKSGKKQKKAEKSNGFPRKKQKKAERFFATGNGESKVGGGIYTPPLLSQPKF